MHEKIPKFLVVFLMAISGVFFFGLGIRGLSKLFTMGRLSVFDIGIAIGMVLFSWGISYASFRMMKKGLSKTRSKEKDVELRKLLAKPRANPSLIKKTKQQWKIVFGGLVLAAGGIPLILMDFVESADRFIIIRIICSIVGLFGFVILVTSVRCPFCKAKWLWLLASKNNVIEKWGGPLSVHNACPECDNTGKRKYA